MRATRRTPTGLPFATAPLVALAGLTLAAFAWAGLATMAGPVLAKPVAGRVPVPRSAASSEVDAWRARRLAAQLVFCSVPAAEPLAGRRFAKMGVGGIVILGGGARSSIGRDLAAVLREAPHGIKPFVASDEEGGQVQRLRSVIYPLPSARVQGGWSTWKTRTTARDYGARLRRLHVSVVFGPVADLDIPGRYMSSTDRCFSRKPSVVSSHVVAWVKGLRASGVLATVKHWPGHGWATDTHTGAARIPSLSVLRREDMVPFEQAFDAGVPLVMVGHLRSKGLTGDETPASLSRRALTYLRARTGDATVIVTDSLSMAATTSAVGLKLPAAAVRALRAGADLALFATGDPKPVIDAVTAAIRSGRIPRAAAETKVRRILELKRAAGLAPVSPP